MSLVFSQQQQDILDFIAEKTGSLGVLARAGCGKSFICIHAINWIYHNTGYEVFIGSFNKDIAVEMDQKLKNMGIDDWRRVQVGTMHGAGFSAWRRVAKNVRVDDTKVETIIDQLYDLCVTNSMTATSDSKRVILQRKAEIARTMRDFAIKAVGFAKQRAFGFLCSIEDRAKWFDIVDHFGLDEEIEDIESEDERTAMIDEGINLAIAVYKKSVQLDHEVIDFNDMILAPLIHNARMYPKDFVFLDEAQDTNPARRALALKMLRPRTGRLVFVGDNKQTIYSFTGADTNSMTQLQEATNATILPLNETRRCSKAVVQYANQWVSDLTAHEQNLDGAVHTIKYGSWMGSVETPIWYKNLSENDAVICRNNAPLVQVAFDLLARGVACHIEGKDIAGGLEKLTRRWKTIKTLTAFDDKLTEYAEREIQKALAKDKNRQADAISDRVEVLKVMINKLIMEGKTEISDLRTMLANMFGDHNNKKKCVTLCSGHRSKGREFNKVYWIDRTGTIPSRWAKKDWEFEAEECLAYVIATRAIDELIEVQMDATFTVRNRN